MYRLHCRPGLKVEDAKKIIRRHFGSPGVIAGGISSIERFLRVPGAQCLHSQRHMQNLAPKNRRLESSEVQDRARTYIFSPAADGRATKVRLKLDLQAQITTRNKRIAPIQLPYAKNESCSVSQSQILRKLGSFNDLGSMRGNHRFFLSPPSHHHLPNCVERHSFHCPETSSLISPVDLP